VNKNSLMKNPNIGGYEKLGLTLLNEAKKDMTSTNHKRTLFARPR